MISNAVRLINDGELHDGDAPFDIAEIPMDDPDVYAMIGRGDTTGVFQLESSGFKELLTQLKPDRFEDIIAAVALYRPGPLEGGMVDQFIECKHGRRKITYPHPLLKEVLAETYGVFVYQEQVMQGAQILAGFSLGAADLMRRAMGKKKKAEMDRQRALFVKGCADKNDIDEKKANEIFDLIDKFAGYGFNKSHSAAYGLITYQTAYLKCHFRVAFMAALMTCDKDKNENVVKFIAEARGSGIEVLPPCVNESQSDFSVVKRLAPACGDKQGQGTKPEADAGAEGYEQLIRFGLGAVRNVGSGAVDSILATRSGEDGPFTSLYDLCRRVDLKKVNKRTLEGLLRSGRSTGSRTAGGARSCAARSIARSTRGKERSATGRRGSRACSPRWPSPRACSSRSTPTWPSGPKGAAARGARGAGVLSDRSPARPVPAGRRALRDGEHRQAPHGHERQRGRARRGDLRFSRGADPQRPRADVLLPAGGSVRSL